jgi:hypothetical protein
LAPTDRLLPLGPKITANGRSPWPENSSCTRTRAESSRFRLKAGNGEIIAVGEAYESKAAAKNGVESVKKNASDATLVDLTE